MGGQGRAGEGRGGHGRAHPDCKGKNWGKKVCWSALAEPGEGRGGSYLVLCRPGLPGLGQVQAWAWAWARCTAGTLEKEHRQWKI